MQKQGARNQQRTGEEQKEGRHTIGINGNTQGDAGDFKRDGNTSVA